MTLKYTNILHSKALQNLPRLGFLVLKYTIWQPRLEKLNDMQLRLQSILVKDLKYWS
jgi:hypothetical protein